MGIDTAPMDNIVLHWTKKQALLVFEFMEYIGKEGEFVMDGGVEAANFYVTPYDLFMCPLHPQVLLHSSMDCRFSPVACADVLSSVT